MVLFVIIVNGFKPLTIITKSKPFTIITNSSILDVAAVLDPPLMSTFNYYEINMKRLITIPRYSIVLTLTKIQSKFLKSNENFQSKESRENQILFCTVKTELNLFIFKLQVLWYFRNVRKRYLLKKKRFV